MLLYRGGEIKMLYFSIIITSAVFITTGMVISKEIKNTNKYFNIIFDFALIILTILSLFTGGINTYVIKIFSFEMHLSIALSSLFLGILIGRFISKYLLVKKQAL